MPPVHITLTEELIEQYIYRRLIYTIRIHTDNVQFSDVSSLVFKVYLMMTVLVIFLGINDYMLVLY